MSDKSFEDALATYRRKMNAEEKALSTRLGIPTGTPPPERDPAAPPPPADYGGGQHEPPGIGPTHEPPSMNQALRAAFRGRRSR